VKKIQIMNLGLSKVLGYHRSPCAVRVSRHIVFRGEFVQECVFFSLQEGRRYGLWSGEMVSKCIAQHLIPKTYPNYREAFTKPNPHIRPTTSHLELDTQEEPQWGQHQRAPAQARRAPAPPHRREAGGKLEEPHRWALGPPPLAHPERPVVVGVG
jgi:hypothetical protein